MDPGGPRPPRFPCCAGRQERTGTPGVRRGHSLPPGSARRRTLVGVPWPRLPFAAPCLLGVGSGLARYVPRGLLNARVLRTSTRRAGKRPLTSGVRYRNGISAPSEGLNPLDGSIIGMGLIACQRLLIVWMGPILNRQLSEGGMAEDPLYVRLADELRAQIARGEWAGEALPPERVLAEERQISRNTVIKAYDVLTHEGLVTPGRGRAGRKVRDRRVLTVFASRSEQLDRMITSSVDTWVSDVREDDRHPGQSIGVGVVNASEDLASWLGIETDSPVAVRRRLRTIDGRPDNIADTYYPPAVTNACPEIMNPTDVPQGVLTLMADKGFPQLRCEDRLRWGPATPEEASQLKLAPGVSVLRQNRIGYGPDDLPIRVAVTVWPGDTHELRYEMSS